jgi:hypothetical protein
VRAPSEPQIRASGFAAHVIDGRAVAAARARPNRAERRRPAQSFAPRHLLTVNELFSAWPRARAPVVCAPFEPAGAPTFGRLRPRKAHLDEVHDDD